MAYLDIKGQTFNRLTALEYVGKNKYGRAMWRCKCECGNEVTVDVSSLRLGRSGSCGCYHIDRLSDCTYLHTTHGMSKSRLYRIWNGMIQRCKSNKYYTSISVCNEWMKFETFRDWALSNGYRDDLTIDRIDYRRNYEPDNCRWATPAEQTRNTSHNHNMTLRGVTKCQAEWLSTFGLKSKKSFQRLRERGMSDNQILNYYAQKKGVCI